MDRLEAAQQGPAAPPTFSLAEVGQHNTEKDCWMVVHDLVYNVTDYLLKHPGGYDLIFKHAGGDCTQDFEGMFHSAKARKILESMCIGQIRPSERKSSKSLNPFSARQMAMFSSGTGTGPYGLGRPAAAAASAPGTFADFKAPAAPASRRAQPPPILQAIDPVSFRTFKLISSEQVSHDTKILRFAIPYEGQLNVPVGRHIIVSTVVDGQMTKREYTPITDEKGYFELMVKKYPNGPVSSFLHSRVPGDQVMMRGLFGSLKWDPDMLVKKYSHLLLIGAGSGIAPLYQVIKAFLGSAKLVESDLKMTLIDANHTKEDILLKSKIENLREQHPTKLEVKYVLSRELVESESSSDGIEYFSGRLDDTSVFSAAMASVPRPANRVFALLCGPDLFCAVVKLQLTASQDPAMDEEQVHVF